MSDVVAPAPRARRIGLPGGGPLGPLGALSAGVVGVAVLVAVLGPAVAPHDPNAGELSSAFVGPEAGHPLGFDGQGRDLLSRLLAGGRTALLGPLCMVLASVTAGTLLAVVGAWRGGRFDALLAAASNVLFAFPAILTAILAATMFGAGLVAASLALTIAFTPYVVRVVRSAAVRERAQPYVAALEVLGVPATTICLRHLLPNVLPVVVAQGTLLFGYAVIDLAAVSYLGLGVQPPEADWGVMVATGQSGVLQGYPAESLSAGLCIVIVVVAANVLGERMLDRAEGRR